MAKQVESTIESMVKGTHLYHRHDVDGKWHWASDSHKVFPAGHEVTIPNNYNGIKRTVKVTPVIVLTDEELDTFGSPATMTAVA